MTEMSFPSLDDADEFGGIDHLVPPGQDPELLRSLLAAFTDELMVRDCGLMSVAESSRFLQSRC